MREKQDMEASCNKRLESIKNAMKNLNPESKDYKEQLANLEKQYDNEMRRYDIKRKAIERREVKMHLLANKGKLAIAAHGGSVNPNSIFAKGTIGWINRRRQELGAVGDKLTGGWFNDRNEVKMDAYQDVINATQSLINQSIATREKIGLEKSEVIEAGLDQVNTLESKSIYDAMSQVNKKDYNDDKHFIPRRQTSDYSKKDEDKIHYGEELTEDLKATHIINGYKALENKGQTFNLVEEYNKISKDNNLTEEQKNEVRKYILSSRNAVVDTKNITNKTNNFYKILVNDVMLKSSISDVMKNKDNWEMMGNLAELFGRADVQQGMMDYYAKNNLNNKLTNAQQLQMKDWINEINNGAAILKKAKEKVAKKTEAATKKETQQGWSDYLNGRAQESSSSTSNQTQQQNTSTR